MSALCNDGCHRIIGDTVPARFLASAVDIAAEYGERVAELESENRRLKELIESLKYPYSVYAAFTY